MFGFKIQMSRRFGGTAIVFFIACWFLESAQGQPVSEPTTTKRYQDFVNEIMDTVDVDNDGAIDESEKQKFDRPLFDQADRNGDGLITSEEILAKVSGQPLVSTPRPGASRMSDVQVPKTVNIKIAVLKLPRAFADHQVVSVQDILTKAMGKNAKEEMKEISDGAQVRLMDQFEMTVIDGTANSLSLQGEAASRVFKSNQNGVAVWEQSKRPFESSLEVTPRIHDEYTQLKVDMSANYAVHDPVLTQEQKQDLDEVGVTPVFFAFSSTFQFHQKNIATANVLSSGHHFLLVASIQH